MPDELDHLAECLRLIQQRAQKLRAYVVGNPDMEGAACVIGHLAKEAAGHHQAMCVEHAALRAEVARLELALDVAAEDRADAE